MKSTIFDIKEVKNLTLYYFDPDLKKSTPICHIDYAQTTGLEKDLLAGVDSKKVDFKKHWTSETI